MTEVCRAFRNTNHCRFGDSCKFEHSEGDSISAPPRGPCFNFTEDGVCEYGDTCRFTHGDNDGRFDEEGHRVPQAKKASKSRRAPRGPKPRGECFGFSESGDCKFGDECRFTHGDEDTRFAHEEQTSASSAKPRRRNRRRDGPPEKLDEVCNNYSLGKCRYGDNCRRVHEGSVEQVVDKIDELCRNFQEGNCRFGDLCRRQHTEAA